MYDVIIIGAGVVGSAIARELSRFKVKACVIDKCEDVCEGTSKANSGIIHAGYDALNGTLKAKLNLLGNEMMDQLAIDLNIPFKRNGSFVVCLREEDRAKLEILYQRGIENGVKGLRIVEREELFKMEPNLSEDTVCALFAPTAGIVCPFQMTIAFAENAYVNGVEFKLGTEVLDIIKANNEYLVETNSGVFKSRVVVNAAGVYADVIHNMVSKDKMEIIPRRGDYCLLDKAAGDHVSKTIFPLPNELGKGILVAPTIHGNLIVGPTAMDTWDKEGTNVRKEGFDVLLTKSSLSVKNIPMYQVINSFAGLRAHESGGDFIIREVLDAKNFFDVAGIESPGLSSAPAIGVMVADMVAKELILERNSAFIATREGIRNPSLMSLEERQKLIKENPAYGNVICRCEMVTEGEIMDAINRPLGARTLDAVKRRTRAGSGRCQAGFCTPKTMEILARELNLTISEITKNGKGSKMIVGVNKDSL